MKNLIRDVVMRRFERVETATLPPGVLSVMAGPAMEIENVNENNRWYPRPLIISRILNNEEVKHLMKNNALIGEGCHPDDRFHTIYPNAAILVKKLWIPDNDQDHLHIEFWILDTPIGRILKTLLDVGSSIGISARAAGTSDLRDGVEYMNEEDYTFFTFDTVPDPGFKSARVVPVFENKILDKEIKDYSDLELAQTKSLMESLNKEVFSEQITQIQSIQESRNPTPVETPAPANELAEAQATISRLQAQLEAQSRPSYIKIPESVLKKVSEQAKTIAELQGQLKAERKRRLANRQTATHESRQLTAQSESTIADLTEQVRVSNLERDGALIAVNEIKDQLTKTVGKKDHNRLQNTLNEEKEKTRKVVGSLNETRQALTEQKKANRALSGQLYESQVQYLASRVGLPIAQVKRLVPKVEGKPDRYVEALRKHAQRNAPVTAGKLDESNNYDSANEYSSRDIDGLVSLVENVKRG